jgi:Spy/CpxP family protein refolding chaperone
MITKRIFFMLLLSLMLLAGTGAALAQNPPETLVFLKNRLGLTGQQVSAIRELQRKHREDVLPLEQQLRAKNQALRAALEVAQPSTATVGQIVIDQQALRKQLNAHNEKLRTDILALLTPEQKQKFEHLGLASLGEIVRRSRK